MLLPGKWAVTRQVGCCQVSVITERVSGLQLCALSLRPATQVLAYFNGCSIGNTGTGCIMTAVSSAGLPGQKPTLAAQQTLRQPEPCKEDIHGQNMDKTPKLMSHCGLTECCSLTE